MLKLCYSSGDSLYLGHQPQTLHIMKHKSLTRALHSLTKILLLLTVLLCVDTTAKAQYIPDTRHIQYRNGNLYTTEGVKLDKSTAVRYMNGNDYDNYYLKGKRLFTSGIVLSATGAGIIAGSVLFDVIYSSTQNNQATGDIHTETYYLPVVSLTGAIVGGTLLVASIPLYWVGTVKLKRRLRFRLLRLQGVWGWLSISNTADQNSSASMQRAEPPPWVSM